MKSSVSFTIIVAIIFIQALTPFTEENKKGDFDWHGDAGAIDIEGDWAHRGYSLNVPDNVKSYWLAFRVAASTEDDKWRGPFNNDGDKCWHFHGTIDSWNVFEC
ncbi:unnamed protein product [Rhizophagus irregularis]|uniref:Uncharacterized protein n=1 Tax=Rhizophagus irregularis TaxID=588596 RepID=A0A916DYI6_9GLOM|nr:unnamed protein product [Rhizophagus irregularis]